MHCPSPVSLMMGVLRYWVGLRAGIQPSQEHERTANDSAFVVRVCYKAELPRFRRSTTSGSATGEATDRAQNSLKEFGSVANTLTAS